MPRSAADGPRPAPASAARGGAPSLPVAPGPGSSVAAPGWDDEVARARRAVDQVRAHPAQRRHLARNAAEAGLRAARLSAAIEGVPLALPVTSVPPVLVGAARAGAALPELVGAWSRSPRQVLARLHLLAAAGSAGDDEIGRPRADPAAVAALGRVSDLVTSGGQPAPVLVALVHRELLVSAPFAVANGVVARAAARLTMMSTGLDPDGLTVPEIAYLRWFRPDSGAVPLRWDADDWVRRTVDALVDGAREASAIADAAG